MKEELLFSLALALQSEKNIMDRKKPVFYVSSKQPLAPSSTGCHRPRAKLKAECSLHRQSGWCGCKLSHTCLQQNFLHLLKLLVQVKWDEQVEIISYLGAALTCGLGKEIHAELGKQFFNCQVSILGNGWFGKKIKQQLVFLKQWLTFGM